jgi:alpha-L-rhamnosidase
MTKLVSIFLFLNLLFLSCANSQIEVTALRTNNLNDPLGIGKYPKFGWRIVAAKRNTNQTAYQLQVSSRPDFNDKALLWNSGKVATDQSLHISMEEPH